MPDDEKTIETSPLEGSRRSFLTGAGAAAVASGLGLAACSAASDGSDASAADGGSGVEAAVATAADPTPVAFGGDHQAGVLVPVTAAGIFAAFDVVAADLTSFATAMEAMSAEIARLMRNEPLTTAADNLPPADSGAVDPAVGTAGVAVTVAFGSSVFDGRFGLADRRPSELTEMPLFPNDRLVRPSRSHGDVGITITAPNRQLAAFALHQIVRVTERRLQVKWVHEGFNQLLPPAPDRVAPSRNLMGFRDGTSNLDTTDAKVMDRHVWVQPDDGEPDWAIGGTYQVTRVIRMLIEFWATAALVRQEQIFGRHRDTGAPLGQASEVDEPSFADDPSDDTIPRRSHMRLANPRTEDVGRILRRGFSYLDGADDSGTLDQGLLFQCYQRSLSSGFLEVQGRLNGEPLEDYVRPVGGGFYFVLPGPGDGWLGQTLLAP